MKTAESLTEKSYSVMMEFGRVIEVDWILYYISYSEATTLAVVNFAPLLDTCFILRTIEDDTKSYFNLEAR